MKVSDCCWIRAIAVTNCVFFISWLPKFNVQPLNRRNHMQVAFIYCMRDISKGKIQVLLKKGVIYTSGKCFSEQMSVTSDTIYIILISCDYKNKIETALCR